MGSVGSLIDRRVGLQEGVRGASSFPDPQPQQQVGFRNDAVSVFFPVTHERHVLQVKM